MALRARAIVLAVREVGAKLARRWWEAIDDEVAPRLDRAVAREADPRPGTAELRGVASDARRVAGARHLVAGDLVAGSARQLGVERVAVAHDGHAHDGRRGIDVAARARLGDREAAGAVVAAARRARRRRRPRQELIVALRERGVARRAGRAGRPTRRVLRVRERGLHRIHRGPQLRRLRIAARGHVARLARRHRERGLAVVTAEAARVRRGRPGEVARGARCARVRRVAELHAEVAIDRVRRVEHGWLRPGLRERARRVAHLADLAGRRLRRVARGGEAGRVPGLADESPAGERVAAAARQRLGAGRRELEIVDAMREAGRGVGVRAHGEQPQQHDGREPPEHQ